MFMGFVSYRSVSTGMAMVKVLSTCRQIWGGWWCGSQLWFVCSMNLMRLFYIISEFAGEACLLGLWDRAMWVGSQMDDLDRQIHGNHEALSPSTV